jgi:hypothetical protein
MRTSRAILAISALLAIFLAAAHLAASRSSCTYDETLHVTSAYVIRHTGDFRVNPEDPPLFQRVAALGLPAGSLQPNYEDSAWQEMLTELVTHWRWCNAALFGQGTSVSPVAVDAVSHAREMMLSFALLLGIATALLARALSPRSAAIAAVLATALVCLDPNFIGHASLVKNDIALSLSFTLTALALVLISKRISPASLVLLALAPAIGVTTKFSGLLLGPAVTLALLARALLPVTWDAFGRPLATRARRLAAAGGLVLACTATSYLAVWAVYGFRSALTIEVGAPMHLDAEAHIAQVNIAWGDGRTTKPTDAEVNAIPVPTPIRAMRWAGEHRLVPEAFAKGFNYTYATTLLRCAFLLDQISYTGWWYYFPLTLLFKLPLSTLALVATAAFLAARNLLAHRPPCPTFAPTLIPATGPVIVVLFYFLTALSGNLNLGIRHMLPILPTVFALAAAAIANAWAHRRIRIAALTLLATLALELGTSGQRYLAFFNIPARLYGPEHLLSDSSLDWGQDLPLLATWAREHPNVTLSLAYFGTAAPEAYGLKCIHLQGTSYSRTPIVVTPPPGVVAISATHLQEVYLKASERGVYELFRRLRPREVLGGTLFLYNWPPEKSDLADHPWNIDVRLGNQLVPIPSGTNPTWKSP